MVGRRPEHNGHAKSNVSRSAVRLDRVALVIFSEAAVRACANGHRGLHVLGDLLAVDDRGGAAHEELEDEVLSRRQVERPIVESGATVSIVQV